MPDDQHDLEARIAAIEQARGSGVPGWVKDAAALLSPLVLAVLGFYFNSVLKQAETEIAEARAEIQEHELHIRRIQTAQSIMDALFREDYDEARVLSVLFEQLLVEDATLHASIGGSIDEYFKAKWQRIPGGRALNKAELAALQETAAQAAIVRPDSTLGQDDETRLHVVLVSLARDDPAKFGRVARIAQDLADDPDVPAAEIWCSTTGIGFFALTAGRHSPWRAEEIAEAALGSEAMARHGLTSFYITRGEHLVRQVWPDPPAGVADPCIGAE